MSDEASDSSANYVLLTRLADEFAARYRAGERPGLREYIDRYPHLADDIRELFPAMAEIEQVKEDGQGVVPDPAAVPAPALRQLGDFRIIREVGKGGMGIVYEAGQGRDGSKSGNKKQNYWQSVASIGVQAANALEYAHKQGINHRDIKPSKGHPRRWRLARTEVCC